MIVPVLEEVLVVQKRLMLKEEVHVIRRKVETHQPQHMLLRSEEVIVERVAPEEPGTFTCDPSWIAPITGTTALAAAQLDANRISQQFAAG